MLDDEMTTEGAADGGADGGADSGADSGAHGPADGGGILVATAYGLGHWHPSAPPNLLAWPEPMALDNHWILIEEA